MSKYFYNERLWELSLSSVGVFSWLLPIALLLISRRFFRPEFGKILAFAGFSYLLEHLSSDVDIKHLFGDGTNAPWYHIGTPVLFYLMTRFYSIYLAGKENYRLDIYLPVAFLLLAVINALYLDGFYRFPTLTIGLYSVAGIIMAAGYFVHLLRKSSVVKLETEPLFWISGGFLIYYSGNFLLWGGVTFLNGDRDFFNSIYRINAWMTILLNCMFILAIITAHPLKPELNPTSTNET